MKQSLIQVVDFFKKHKFGRISLVLLLTGLVISSTLLFRSGMQEKPIPISEVATAISAGQVIGIKDFWRAAS